MKVKIIMKSGNAYFTDLTGVRDIKDVYAALHLNYDGLMVLDKSTIINPLEAAEVITIDEENKQQDFDITLNIDAPVDVEMVMNKLSEKLKQANSQML